MRLQLVVALMFLGAVALCSAADMTVYTDSLQNGWQYWGWATTQSFSYAGPPTPVSGSASISYKPAGWDALYFRAASPIPFSFYPTFEFYINGGTSGGQSVNLAVNQNVNEPKAQVSIATLTPNKAITANIWQKVSVTWSSLGITSGNLVEFWITDATGNTQTTLYLDSITLKGTTTSTTTTTTTTTAAPTLTVTVDTTKNVRAVNQNIYGVNWASAAMLASVKYPVNRWGGNSVSLYNWQQSIKNSGADWFYISTPDTVANPAGLPEGSASDVFVDQSKAAGSAPMLTAPMLGYTPLDSRTKKWSYSVSKYGAQTGTECTGSGGASWCAADAGNGIRSSDGSKITTNNRADAYKVIDRTYTTTWMDHLRSRGTPVTFWNLDNEPGLWDSTHQDVHPSPLTYDELWTKTKDIAAAIKAKDSTAVTFGPASWGWCEYWFSPADGCSVGADRTAHGGTRLLEWYATQNCAYKAANGVQLVDYLDFHFYPQGTGVALSSAEDSATAGRRLRSVKALYDPTYVDESWINQVVRIIPDLRNVIATKCPSMKLSITEYNFGNDDIITGAIATAEALAIFGREGVDLATRWVAPEVGSKVENAFKLYLNYDGAGGKVTGSSVSTVSANVDVIGSYSIFNSSAKKLFVLLFNKATSAKTVKVNLASFTMLSTTAAKLYRFTGSQNLALASSSVSISAGSVTLSNLPAYSANLLVIPTP